jgi:hypothetical protein
VSEISPLGGNSMELCMSPMRCPCDTSVADENFYPRPFIMNACYSSVQWTEHAAKSFCQHKNFPNSSDSFCFSASPSFYLLFMSHCFCLLLFTNDSLLLSTAPVFCAATEVANPCVYLGLYISRVWPIPPLPFSQLHQL